LAHDLPGDDPRGIDARRADTHTDLLLSRDVPGAAPAPEPASHPLAVGCRVRCPGSDRGG
jgi:hypothetical protein